MRCPHGWPLFCRLSPLPVNMQPTTTADSLFCVLSFGPGDGHSTENDDGRRFFRGHGLFYTVYGSHNIAGLNVKGAAERQEYFTRYLRSRTKEMFVLSGFRGIHRLLETMGRADFHNSLLMEYPRRKRRKHSMVGKIAGSFTPGNLAGDQEGSVRMFSEKRRSQRRKLHFREK